MKTMLFVLLLMTAPAYAQVTIFNDSAGRTGSTWSYGNGLGTYQDSTGTTGTFNQIGKQGFYQGSDGTIGSWMDLGMGMRSFSDSKGGTGSSMDLGGGLGTYQYQSPKGSTHGSYMELWPRSR